MYPRESAEENRVSLVQLNAELRRAQLELLSAHCAAHQLRLHYSTDDLARFGRTDLLRKSAEAANALSAFYTAVEKRMSIVSAAAAAHPATPPTNAQITEAVGWIESYLREQRDRYWRIAGRLSGEHRALMAPYFSAAVLDRIRIIELKGARVSAPEFLTRVQVLGFDGLPDIPHMESLTFIDVVAFNEKLSERALFHALVHSVQIEVLGLRRYSELWVRGFLRSRAHFTVPLEVHAFSLASKFSQPEQPTFSVEQQVREWEAQERY
jgi:hypothetical protein